MELKDVRFAGRGRHAITTAVVALVTAAGLGLAGCASDNGEAEGSGDAELTDVSVAYSSPGASYADLYVADQEGIFEKHGLHADIRALNSSGGIIPALLSGSVDIAVGSANNAAAAIMGGEDIRFIALTRKVFNLEVYAGEEFESIEDLAGEPIGITAPGSQSDKALTAMLEEVGMTREDVKPTFVQSIPGQLAALRAGQVSAILTQPPQGLAAVDAGFPRLAGLSHLPFPSAGVVVTGKFLEENPDTVQAFIDAEIEALGVLQTDREATIKAIMDYSGEESEENTEYAYDFFTDVWATDPTVTEDLIRMAFELAAEETGGEIPEDITQYIDNSFIEASPVALPEAGDGAEDDADAEQSE